MHRHAVRTLSIVLLALLLSACGGSTPVSTSTSAPASATQPPPASATQPAAATATTAQSAARPDPERMALLNAAATYMSQTPTTAYGLIVEGVEGDFARVTAAPIDFDITTIFLKREAGAWSLLSAGTAFMDDDLAALNIPAALRAPAAELDEQIALTQAGASYIRGFVDETGETFFVTPSASEGDFARLLVVPELDNTPGFLYMKREGSSWQGLVVGAPPTAEEYEQFNIPQGLRV